MEQKNIIEKQIEKQKEYKLKKLLKKLKIINIINSIILYLIFVLNIFLIMKYQKPIKFLIKDNFLKNSIDFIIGIIVFWGFFIRTKINEIVIKIKKSFIDSKDVNFIYLIYNIILFVNYEYLIYFNHYILRTLLFCIITIFAFSIFYLEYLEKKYCPDNNIFCIEKFYKEIESLKEY